MGNPVIGMLQKFIWLVCIIVHAACCAMASQTTSLTIAYSTVYSGVNQRTHQSSASRAFMRGIHRWPVNSPHKGPVTRKCFHWMTYHIGCCGDDSRGDRGKMGCRVDRSHGHILPGFDLVAVMGSYDYTSRHPDDLCWELGVPGNSQENDMHLCKHQVHT